MWSVSTGVWWLHLRLLCCGDGHQNDSPGDFWIKVLPWWHMEPPGLLHCHGRVRNPLVFSLVTHAFNHYHHSKAGEEGPTTRFTGHHVGNRITVRFTSTLIHLPFKKIPPLLFKITFKLTKSDEFMNTSLLKPILRCKINRKKGYRDWPLVSDACSMFPLLCFLQDDGVFNGRS